MKDIRQSAIEAATEGKLTFAHMGEVHAMSDKKFVYTDSIVAGDTIRWAEPVFSGSFRKPKCIGERNITALVERESYGEAKQQHTFSMRVVEAEGAEAPAPGAAIRRKGRNLYKGLLGRLPWQNEEERDAVAQEKHARGDQARAARQRRIEELKRRADEFTASSIALLRSAVGWQSEIARRLGVSSRTVRRWLAAGEVPEWAEARLGEMMGGTAAGPWPRDEWIIGEGKDGREYVMHTAPPRFIARVVMTDEKDGTPLDSEEPADLVGGIVYAVDPETVLCEIDWIDEPQPGEITALMEAAAEAIGAAG